MPFNIKKQWIRFWMRYAGLDFAGRIATKLATLAAPPYYARCYLARLNPNGYISPNATIYHNNMILGQNVFIGDRVVIYEDKGGGIVKIGDKSHLYGDTTLQTGLGGSIDIDSNTHIHPRCQISAYRSNVVIGKDVQIAANCAFYPYDHGIQGGVLIQEQPLTSKGDIIIEEDVWLGYGVKVLSGVHIGKGAVIGAGSVVNENIADNGIAVGSPAKVKAFRRIKKIN